MKVNFYNEFNGMWYFDTEIKIVDTITMYDIFVASVDFIDGNFLDIYKDPIGCLIGKIYKEGI